MTDTLNSVFQTITDRKATPKAGSYTNSLFDAGLDEITKKVGEDAIDGFRHVLAPPQALGRVSIRASAEAARSARAAADNPVRHPEDISTAEDAVLLRVDRRRR